MIKELGPCKISVMSKGKKVLEGHSKNVTITFTSDIDEVNPRIEVICECLRSTITLLSKLVKKLEGDKK